MDALINAAAPAAADVASAAGSAAASGGSSPSPAAGGHSGPAQQQSELAAAADSLAAALEDAGLYEYEPPERKPGSAGAATGAAQTALAAELKPTQLLVAFRQQVLPRAAALAAMLLVQPESPAEEQRRREQEAQLATELFELRTCCNLRCPSLASGSRSSPSAAGAAERSTGEGGMGSWAWYGRGGHGRV